MKANEDIRKMAAHANVYLWQIADQLGVVDSTFSRKLRKELQPEERSKILTIIANLQAERRR